MADRRVSASGDALGDQHPARILEFKTDVWILSYVYASFMLE